MKKRGIAVLMAAFVLLAANMVTVFAEGEDIMPLYSQDSWYVSSYPGIAGSDSCYIMRQTWTFFEVMSNDYYSSGTSNGIQVTSSGSNEMVYITSVTVRSMDFKNDIKNGDTVSVNFYAYSPDCRIYGQGIVVTL